MKVRELSLQFRFDFESQVSCFEQDNDLDVASVIFFIFAYSVNYIFIFSLPFDLFIHYLKYPYQKPIINQHISVLVC